MRGAGPARRGRGGAPAAGAQSRATGRDVTAPPLWHPLGSGPPPTDRLRAAPRAAAAAVGCGLREPGLDVLPHPRTPGAVARPGGAGGGGGPVMEVSGGDTCRPRHPQGLREGPEVTGGGASTVATRERRRRRHRGAGASVGRSVGRPARVLTAPGAPAGGEEGPSAGPDGAWPGRPRPGWRRRRRRLLLRRLSACRGAEAVRPSGPSRAGGAEGREGSGDRSQGTPSPRPPTPGICSEAAPAAAPW